MTPDKCDTRIIHMEKVTMAKDSSLEEAELVDLALFFKTFADPSRLKIMMALAQQEMCVCDIAAFLDISESAVSHQLRYLRGSRLVKNRRDGTILYYRLTDNHVKEMIDTGLEHIRE
ncbi:ArsR/SmtB family transcription factor [Desulfopila inferna]|uniref:ArsR/SmtB family transcription factor n=1 Tax=Desulfopila inferna TaxID=468528 RepID=UPI001965FB72|nr:metalloregulator ArsR/SmtB family transcription factor [Desulfopila inferna]MBM9606015.1 winged helix-turn-helix transcriptional regulator [Desulfopila inferna]